MKLPQSLTYPGIGFFTSVTALLAAPVAAAEQAELVDRAKEVGLADAPGYGKAVSMIDVNGDGWEDLWDSNTNRRPPSPERSSLPRFYLNQKDGSNDIVFNLGGAAGWDFRNGTESRAMNTFYSRKGGNQQTAQFRLEGVDSNRDAIGARIRVTVAPEGKPPQTFHYSVRSAEGFQSQNSSWQLVNLMGTEQAAVELRWPSGRVSQHTIRVGARGIFREPPPSQ